MMELQPAICNWSTTTQYFTIARHSRTILEADRKRHLLRLWLAPAGARALPEVYAERFGSLTPGQRGGVVVPGATPVIPFE
jgi:hypothetical protein